MKALYLGSRGPEVRRWQTFLRGRSENSSVVVNGEFDTVTLTETKQFQADNGLTSDGVVGPRSFAAALNLGYPAVVDDTVEQDGPNWPPRPAGLPLAPLDRAKLFGRFAFVPAPTPTNPEAIKFTDGWADKNIVTVSVPQLVGVPGTLPDGAIQVHKNASEQFLRLFECWQSEGLVGNILTWGGSWAPRFVRGSRTSLSNHAWGTAFDINVQWNGLGATPALHGKKGSVRELVQTAYENGFYWGGWFKGRPDGMHFEVCRLT